MCRIACHLEVRKCPADRVTKVQKAAQFACILMNKIMSMLVDQSSHEKLKLLSLFPELLGIQHTFLEHWQKVS